MANNAGLSRAQQGHTLQLWRSAAFDGILLSRGTRLTHSYPRHWHEELHLCAYTSGSGYLRYRGNSYQVVAGDFVVTPPGEVHQNWVDSGPGISFCGVYIDARAFHQASEHLAGRGLSIPGFRDFFLRDKLVLRRFLAVHLAAKQNDSQLEQEESFLEFLHLFLSRCSSQRDPGSPLGSERQSVKRVRQYIDENFTAAISLAYLARLTSLSPFYLHRVFCQKVGMPPHAYQMQLRINYAKQLLRECHPLSAVALSAGFADQSHLTRHFHRLVGVTPGRFLD